jgi:hypothetical protein
VRFGQFGQFALMCVVMAWICSSDFVRSLHGLERHKEKRVVSGLHLAQQTEAFDGRVIFYAGRVFQNVLDLFADGVGAFERRGVGQLRDDKA